jgi:hypothetical protein
MAMWATLKRWMASEERRQEDRMKVPLVALFQNGGAPKPHPVKDVTAKGAYIVTNERWYAGTIVNMMLHYDPFYTQVAEIAGRPGAAIRMRARLMRSSEDGIGVQFVYLSRQERELFREFLAGAQVRGKK